MSGGVDSSVAAALLQRAGHQVIGLTMRLHASVAEGENVCGGASDLSRAQAAADHLGLPLQIVDLSDVFEERVLRPAWLDYASGRTPNPCLVCNERIKFGALLVAARALGASRLATGHYARVARGSDGVPALFRGLDRHKDQSYFLAGLSPEQLQSVLLPLGERNKPEVRELARELGLPNAEASESQDACLAEVGPDRSLAEALRLRFGAESRPGPVVSSDGRLLGQHRGIHHFTVGQRRGLGIQSLSRSWVKSVQGEAGRVVVTRQEEELLGRRLTGGGLSWLGPATHGPLACQVQVRYRHTAEAALLERRGGGSVEVVFDRPVRAITPGQAAVFYDGERVLGRAWIEAVE